MHLSTPVAMTTPSSVLKNSEYLKPTPYLLEGPFHKILPDRSFREKIIEQGFDTYGREATCTMDGIQSVDNVPLKVDQITDVDDLLKTETRTRTWKYLIILKGELIIIVDSPTTSDKNDLLELVSEPSSPGDSEFNELVVHSPTYFNEHKASTSSSTSSSDFKIENLFQDTNSENGEYANTRTIESPAR
ncbi:hypothetical protein Tco_0771273 [Tanacetum coccineum]|uniref:Uncharacterized protein n=1 Tax=Tanacetum coccineum TaxID=301880 RepID=A0ABQ4ZFM5_9ASTR